MKHYTIISLVFVLGIHYTARPQSISCLGIEQGLSNNTVTKIYKDKFGLMWFGTLNGLNRFDGYNFKQFRNKFGDQASLPHNRITALNEDQQGNLWVGTDKGIGILDNRTFQFSGIYYDSRDDSTVKAKPYDKVVNDIQTDKNGNVFICSADLGLLFYRKDIKKAIQIPLADQNHHSITQYSATAVTVDRKNNVWVTVNTWGLCYYDKKKGIIVPLHSTFPHANCVKQDVNGNLWIGTLRGLFFYNIAAHKLGRFELKDKDLNNSIIWDISFDKSGMLWLATDANGIGVIDVFGNGMSHVIRQGNSGNLTSDAINTIYQDEQARKWIGTLRGGIDIIDPQKEQFRTITHDPNNRNSLVDNFTFAFCEDDSKDIWIGTDGGGISIWNRKANTFKNYTHIPGNIHSLNNNHVSGMIKDNQGNIWISTFGGGVNKFNKNTGNFEDISFGKDNAKPIWRIYLDGAKDIWVTCLSGPQENKTDKLYKYNKNTNSFIPAPFPVNTDILSITDDTDDSFWLGSFTGLIHANKKTGITKVLGLKTAVRALHKSKDGRLWIGTSGRGLMCYNQATDKFISYTEDAGLSNNSVLNIEEDEKGYIWVSTYNGLSKLNPRTGKIEDFYATDGLQSNEFYYNASAKLSSGEMLFGGIKGFNVFNPDSIRQFEDFPPIVITGIRVFNQPVNAKNEFIGNSSSIYNIEHIKLPFDKAILSLDYVALEYSLPEKIEYAYYLKGWDKSWSHVNKLRSLNYTRLDEGDYILKIKSTNASGIWNTKEKVIYVTVLPPWYRAWWAYLLYIGLAGGSIYGYLFYNQKQTKLQYEVKLANIKTIQEKELNEKKISFFTNISHELRTPLTLIANPIKQLLYNKGKDIDLIDISSVYRNARRLLSLVDQLLLFRAAEDEISELKAEWLNLVDVCREVFMCFNNQVQTKSIQYHFECQKENIEACVDREKIEIMLFNLLSNAVKFTPDQGSIRLLLTEAGETVEILVKDTGCGIPEQTGARLFDKFYRLTGANDIAAPSGFGIGLFLTKRYVDIHHGKISYTSKMKEGTVFRVVLPKGDASSITTSHESNEKDRVNSYLLQELAMESNDQIEASPEPIKGETDYVDKLISNVTTPKDAVLLIDDDLALRRYIGKSLKGAYHIYECDNAEDGLNFALHNAPDIIICDVLMKGMSGVEFCSKIKESVSLSHTPVILLTGSSSPEIKLKGIECGADDYITKPFEMELLVARIKSILKGRNNLKNYFFNEITLNSNPLKIPEEYSGFLSKCMGVIEKHIDDDVFNAKTLAVEMGMSKSNLFRKVKSISGLSITEFIRFIRLRKAAELMITTDIRIKEVAFKVGFQQVRYFREQFSKVFGMTPSDFIAKHKNTFSQ